MRVWTLIFLPMFAGCSQPIIKTVPVEVVRIERVPVPFELTTGCAGPDWNGVRTYRDLVGAALKAEAARKECEARLAAIRELKPL